MNESPADPSNPENLPVPAGEVSEGGDTLVKLARYSTAAEADVNAVALRAAGIGAVVLGARTSTVDWFWQGFNDVELHVPAADAERAAEILSRSGAEDLEPVEETGVEPAPTDEQGRALAPVGAYESLTALRDAQAVLASQGIRSLMPRLAPRGDRPAGEGRRFILRVSAADMEVAQSLLEEEAEEDSEEPQCPQCGSWRVFKIPWRLKQLLGFVGVGEKPVRKFECMACHYVGSAGDFSGGFVPGRRPARDANAREIKPG